MVPPTRFQRIWMPRPINWAHGVLVPDRSQQQLLSSKQLFQSKQNVHCNLGVKEWRWCISNVYIQFNIYPSWQYRQIQTGKKLGETNLTTPSINTSTLDGFHHWTNLSELFNVLPTSSLVIIIGHLAGSYEKTQQKQQEQHQFPGRKSGNRWLVCWTFSELGLWLRVLSRCYDSIRFRNEIFLWTVSDHCHRGSLSCHYSQYPHTHVYMAHIINLY